jgi:hypothetical protein
MKGDFKEVMSQHSDAELLEILTKFKDDYQPEAVVAAENEIKKRNLSLVEKYDALLEIEEKNVKTVAKNNTSLDVIQKTLFLIFCWGVIPWLIAGTFKSAGFDKKYNDARKFIILGFAIYLVIISLFFI